MGSEYGRLALSVAAVVLLIGIVATGITKADSSVFLNNNLSSSHAWLEQDCQKCHQKWEGVPDKKCLGCHEGKQQATGVDPGHARGNCTSCHREHRGRNHKPAAIGNAECAGCHNATGHPEKKDDAAQVKVSTGSSLNFPHPAHARRDAFDENSCSICHSLTDGGLYTGMPDFEAECSGCHFTEEHGREAEKEASCYTCHENGNFAPTDHEKSEKSTYRFSHLRHQDTECVYCHPGVLGKNGEQEMADVSAGACFNCHKETRRTTKCVSCHGFHETPVT